jgi:hypothetical protein
MSFAGLEIGWAFCGYLAVVIAFATLLHYWRRMPRFFSLVSLPGTFAHELLHFLLGTLTLARPVRLSLLPKFHRDGSATLGSVTFTHIRWYNALWVGMAPILALPAALWLVYLRSVQGAPPGLQEVAWSYIAASLAYSCVPSKADIAIVLSKPIGLIFYFSCGALLYWMRLASG